METVLRIALSNAALAAVAALLAWVAGKLARRPALTHALWLIVLLKLVTPPIWNVPVKVPQVKQREAQRQEMPNINAPIQSPVLHQQEVARDMRCTDIVAAAGADVVAETRSNDAALERSVVTPANEPSASSGVAWAGTPARARDVGANLVFAHRDGAGTEGRTKGSPLQARVNSEPATKGEHEVRPYEWRRWTWPLLAILWLAGAIVCLVICIARILSFQRLLRFSLPAPTQMQERVDLLSKRLGMGTGPRVVLVNGLVCPMVWPAGRRAAVLVPSALWARLDNHQRDTLLLHELAHLRRRDHWVRWFELLVTVLYWWNPICWWARHELREAEEQCCDAWVLWALPGSFKQYASALLEAVEFVSVRPSAPLLASGMGQFGDLRRRLTMLKQGEVARALSWSGLAAACGAGALLLSIAPTLAQSEKSDKPAESAPLPVTVAPANGNGNNNKPDQPDENGQQQGNGALPAAAPIAVTTPALPRAIEVAPSAPTALPPPTPANVAPLTAEPADPADDDRSDGGDKDSSFRRDMQRQKADQQRQQADQQRQQADAQRQQAEQQRQVSEAKRAQARAQSELDRARRDVEMLSKRLAEASDRLKKLEMADAQANIATKFPANQFDVETRDGRIVSVTPKALTGAAAQKFRFDKSGGEGGYVITKAAPDAEFRINSGAKGGFAYSAVGQPGAKGRSSGDDRERRLEAVERELSELLKEVRQLRDDKDAAPRTPTPQAR